MSPSLLDRLRAGLPSACAVCRGWPAQPVCDACVARFARPRARCERCATLLAPAGGTCGRCLRAPPPLGRCHAAVAYAFPWAALIAAFKFQGQPGWAATFADVLRQAPRVVDALADAHAVLPMPLAPARLAARGFNQAQLLARALAPGKADAGLLLRLRETRPQAELGLADRAGNVKGAFAVDPVRAAEVRGKRLLLVDDVMTSGASLHAAAQALLQAGAAGVGAVVLARTDAPG